MHGSTFRLLTWMSHLPREDGARLSPGGVAVEVRMQHRWFTSSSGGCLQHLIATPLRRRKVRYLCSSFTSGFTVWIQRGGPAMVGSFTPISCREEPLSGVYGLCATCCVCIETGHRGRNDRRVTRDTGTYRIQLSVSRTCPRSH